jgi:hypothetical protein
MADQNEIKQKLIRKIDASIPKVVQASQLEAAAERLIKAKQANRPLLESIGSEVFGERDILQRSDIDDINDVLDQLDE